MCLFIGNVMALHDSVLLNDVNTLTFNTNQFTTGRRSSPIPQLNCIGGGAAHLRQHHPTTVQCYNRGSNGNDIQWECKSELDNSIKFGKTDVVCEGFDYPDDPSILKGSCGLEYSLDYTKERHYHRNHEFEAGSIIGAFFWMMFITLILSSCCGGNTRYYNQYDNYGYGGWGGGGGGGGLGSFGTGAAMGYSMGRSNRPNYGRGWATGPSSYSSGTRTASGFGGTRRR